MQSIPKTVFFLTRSLDHGGAERQLTALAKGLANHGQTVIVAVFFGGGAYEAELLEAGVSVIDLDKKGRWDILPFLGRLLRILHEKRPALLHSYLGIPNILTVLLKPFLRHTRIVWSIRASDVDLSRYDWLSRLAYRLECQLSRHADLVIANSHAGKKHAVANGFPEASIVVIPNGIDTNYFQFTYKGRNAIRSIWKIENNALLIGLVGRLDPMKGHHAFLDAASQLASDYHNIYFVCVGGGAANYSRDLKRYADTKNLTDKLIWVGARDDMPSVFSAMDLLVSASTFGEGFSNTIAEAMACGVPCIVTDVGDSALIVGCTGSVVPANDASALASEILRMAQLTPEQRQVIGRACRARIVSEFGVEKLVNRTKQVLRLP